MLRVGVGLWMPCRVRPGPFTDERMVLVTWEDSEWFGFVNTEWLRHQVEEGDDEVLAKVTAIEGDRFRAIMPGDAPVPSLIEGDVAPWVPVDDSLDASHTERAR